MTTTLTHPKDITHPETTDLERREFEDFIAAHEELHDLARQPTTRRPDRTRLVLTTLVLATLAALLAVLVVATGTEEPIPEVQTAAVETPDEALQRLVDAGYVPAEALWDDAYWTGRLAERGLVPTVAVPAAPTVSETQMTLDLVNQGLVPAETLDADTVVTQRLVDAGLVPTETLD